VDKGLDESCCGLFERAWNKWVKPRENSIKIECRCSLTLGTWEMMWKD